MSGDVTPYEAQLPVREPHDDPSTLVGWPHMFPIELALGEIQPRELCDTYGISRQRFVELLQTPAFRAAYEDAQNRLKKEGMSFRIKAQMQADALLATSWKLIHHEATPANVKADLIKTTYRVAGLEPKETAASVQVPLQINVLL